MGFAENETAKWPMNILFGLQNSQLSSVGYHFQRTALSRFSFFAFTFFGFSLFVLRF
jgi:hypothetical protein